jgi:hypothetical protein
MTIDQIRKAVFAEPFIPFTISLGDGRRFEIRHPEFIMVPREASRIIVAESGEDYNVIDVLLVTSLDFKKRGQRGKTNGKSNGKHRPS